MTEKRTGGLIVFGFIALAITAIVIVPLSIFLIRLALGVL